MLEPSYDKVINMESCRICLSNERRLLSLFRFRSKVMGNYAQMLTAVADIKIASDDGLPDRICRKCCTDLQTAYVLKIVAERTDKELRSLHAKTTIKEEIMETDFQSTKSETGPLMSLKSALKQLKTEDDDENNIHVINRLNIDKETDEVVSQTSDMIDDFDLICTEQHISDSDHDDMEYLDMEFLEEDIFESGGEEKKKKQKSRTAKKSSTSSSKKRKTSARNGKALRKIKSEVDSDILHEDYIYIDDNQDDLSEEETRTTKQSGIQVSKRKKTADEELIQTESKDDVNIVKGDDDEYIPSKKQAKRRTVSANRNSKRMLTELRSEFGKLIFICIECSRTFVQKRNYIAHMDKHAGVKNFTCEKCGASFYSKKSLVRHRLIHGGERRFPCHICPMKYTNGTELRRHFLIHSGCKPFKCTYCPSSFNSRPNLVCHMRVHTGDRPFCCQICNRKYSYKADLNKHALKIHEVDLKYKTIRNLTEDIVKKFKSDHNLTEDKKELNAAEENDMAVIICV